MWAGYLITWKVGASASKTGGETVLQGVSTHLVTAFVPDYLFKGVCIANSLGKMDRGEIGVLIRIRKIRTPVRAKAGPVCWQLLYDAGGFLSLGSPQLGHRHSEGTPSRGSTPHCL